MQFDMKYAYFNFLQSITCSGFVDVTNQENQCSKSCAGTDIEDGSDVAHIANGYDSDVSDDIVKT